MVRVYGTVYLELTCNLNIWVGPLLCDKTARLGLVEAGWGRVPGEPKRGGGCILGVLNGGSFSVMNTSGSDN